jgi:hypothetical protein
MAYTHTNSIDRIVGFFNTAFKNNIHIINNYNNGTYCYIDGNFNITQQLSCLEVKPWSIFSNILCLYVLFLKMVTQVQNIYKKVNAINWRYLYRTFPTIYM